MIIWTKIVDPPYVYYKSDSTDYFIHDNMMRGMTRFRYIHRGKNFVHLDQAKNYARKLIIKENLE